MITKNHPSAYAELFKKAQEILTKYGKTNSKDNRVDNPVSISNIDDYFGVLKALAEIEARAESGKDSYIDEVIDPIFTILPATEETFNIDANSRKISIPDNFAKYGVGVQGDEIAEILYFAIDRYFDAMDLAEMDIIVQWKHSADNEVPESLSATYKKSLTLQPGKIVFGWPITGEMTERAGNIQFSIRFYRRQNNELIYSFSTLPAQIKIQSGLDFELTTDSINNAINRNSQIYNNLRNSVPANVDYVVAAPTFEARWVQLEGSTELVPAENKEYDLPITLAAKAGFAANVEGEISGNGLAYSWYREGTAESLGGENKYKEAQSGEYDNNKEIYYVIEDGVYQPYYSDGNPFDDENVDKVYVRYSDFTPTMAGTYYVKATNAYKHNNFKAADSDKWVIPGPGDPVFEYGNENRELILGDQGSINITATLPENNKFEGEGKWYKSENAIFDPNNAEEIIDASGDSYIPTDEGYYFREVTNSRNGESKVSNSLSVWARHDASDPVIASQPSNNATTLSIVVEAPAYGNITYQWQTNDGIAIEGATSSSYSGPVGGIYKCVVTNTYKGRTKSITSDPAAITG